MYQNRNGCQNIGYYCKRLHRNAIRKMHNRYNLEVIATRRKRRNTIQEQNDLIFSKIHLHTIVLTVR